MKRLDGSDSGYSPTIHAHLLTNGQRFELASLGPDSLSLRSPAQAIPGEGTIRFSLEGQITVYVVQLHDGIDPGRQRHPYHFVRQYEEEAAASAPTAGVEPHCADSPFVPVRS